MALCSRSSVSVIPISRLRARVAVAGEGRDEAFRGSPVHSRDDVVERGAVERGAVEDRREQGRRPFGPVRTVDALPSRLAPTIDSAMNTEPSQVAAEASGDQPTACMPA